MGERGFRAWRKWLCGALSVLLAVTLSWASPWGSGFGAAFDRDAIEDASTPLGAGVQPEGDGSSAVAAVLDAVGDEEAELAAEERVTDADTLGYVPGEIVVVYEDDASPAEQGDVAEAIGPEQSLDPASFETGDVAVVDISDDVTVDTAIEAVEADEAVKCAFPNYVVQSFDDPTAQASSAVTSWLAGDEMASRQWHLSAVKAPSAWELLAGSERDITPVSVAVLDTGASISHPDLKNVLDMSRSGEVVWIDCQSGKVALRPLRGDGYLNGTDEMPFYSTHGTHVAGIIAAEAGNGGVLGVASGGGATLANELVSLASIDIFSCIGRDESTGTEFSSATVNDILYGLAKARDRGCRVANMSLGFYTNDEKCIAVLNEKTAELDEGGLVQVCAAGNDHTAREAYPAACDATLAVISLSKRGAISSSSSTYASKTWESADGFMRSWFSNYGDWCDIAAPGENIYSTVVLEGTLQNDYGSMSGTSMASPVVAAVAAMVCAANPDLSAAEVRSMLCETATDMHLSGKDAETGWGLVNAEEAVKAALPPSAPVPAGQPAESEKSAESDKPAESEEPATLEKSAEPEEPAESQKPAQPQRPAQPQPDTPENKTPAGGQAPERGWKTVGGGSKYYYGTDGKPMVGFGKIDGVWYYFDSAGAMRTGWVRDQGTWYYLDPSSGRMLTGWQKVGGVWYYLKDSGAMVTGWAKVGGSWYYLKSSGAMATGWQRVGGAWYFLKDSGAMATGWYKVGGKWYYSNGSGAMQANRWIGNYYVTASGAMATNTWIGRYHVNTSGLWDKTR